MCRCNVMCNVQCVVCFLFCVSCFVLFCVCVVCCLVFVFFLFRGNTQHHTTHLINIISHKPSTNININNINSFDINQHQQTSHECSTFPKVTCNESTLCTQHQPSNVSSRDDVSHTYQPKAPEQSLLPTPSPNKHQVSQEKARKAFDVHDVPKVRTKINRS
jgi:hypothetical protein